MLVSFALLFLLGSVGKHIASRFSLPGLLGMMIAGMVLGPFGFHLLDDKLLNISAELRKFALVIILTRAGLSLEIDDFKRIGRPAVLLCFVPATCELLAILFFAPKFFGISLLDSAIMGTVLAAVSLAVVVPKMLHLMEWGYGSKKGIPQLIMAGASVDNAYVIVLFSSFLPLAKGEQINALHFIQIPISIVLGILVGILCGMLLQKFFTLVTTSQTIKILLLLSVDFLLTGLEDRMPFWITFSSLLSIMTIGVVLNHFQRDHAGALGHSFNELWTLGEILLFTLVGAGVDLSFAQKAGPLALALIFLVLLFRMAGVYLCTMGANLSTKERLFIMISYTPKATVQAAIGSIPLNMGLPCGQLILTVAVLSILTTAPLGSFFIDRTYQKCLEK